VSTPRVLLLDNYDSFTYNLVQYLLMQGAEVDVRRNDQITVEEALALQPTHVVLSPGPGRPEDAGILCALIAAFLPTGTPMLGVCLGHQALGHVLGGEVVRAPQVMHGKSSPVAHDGTGVFAGLSQPFDAARYHSLVVRRESLPASLRVTAWTEDGLIMGMRHVEMPVQGVQFHPESVLTPEGMTLIANFLGGAS
jgi:anthranilate synthase/aminodeoxychorismate synthase-like glutamine amidotransferase